MSVWRLADRSLVFSMSLQRTFALSLTALLAIPAMDGWQSRLADFSQQFTLELPGGVFPMQSMGNHRPGDFGRCQRDAHDPDSACGWQPGESAGMGWKIG
jgi:hypothetical protein